MRWLTDPAWLLVLPWALGIVKKGGGGAPQQNQADALNATQAQISQDIYNQTQPGRTAAQGLTLGAMTGDLSSPAFASLMAPSRDTYENQFSTARQNILQTAPARGGQLNQALLQQQLQRPYDLARIQQGFQLPLIEAGINTSYGAPSTSLAGLSNASQGALGSASYGQKQQAQNVQQTQQLGYGLGKGAAALFCWIAMLLYGPRSQRVKHLRRGLIQWASRSLAGRLMVRCYVRHGEQTAAWLARHRWAQPPVRWLFNLGLRRLAC